MLVLEIELTIVQLWVILDFLSVYKIRISYLANENEEVARLR